MKRVRWMLWALLAVCALAAQVELQSPESPAVTSTWVHGTVTVSGDQLTPIAGATVTVRDATGGYSTLTAPDGRFAVEARSAMTLRGVVVTKEGFMPATVSLREGSPELSVPLTRAAVISGAVQDQHGQPVAGLWVGVLPVVDPTHTRPPIASSSTDVAGRYVLRDVAPGTYVISASPVRQSRVVTRGVIPPQVNESYYPDASQPRDATRIVVRSGSQLADIDITAGPTQTARVSGSVTRSAAIQGHVDVVLQGLSRVSWTRRPASESGNFQFDDVLTGRYRLSARASARQSVARSLFDVLSPGASLIMEAETIVDVAHADVSGLQLMLDNGHSVADPLHRR